MARLNIIMRQASYALALAAFLWSTGASAQASCSSEPGTANIINHDFTVSFRELCGIDGYEIAAQ